MMTQAIQAVQLFISYAIQEKCYDIGCGIGKQAWPRTSVRTSLRPLPIKGVAKTIDYGTNEAYYALACRRTRLDTEASMRKTEGCRF